MKKIVIFGATGNTGNYLVEYSKSFFNGTDYEIIAVGRKQTQIFENMNVKYFQVDITLASNFDILPKEDIFAVVLLAAKIPSYMDMYDPKEYLDTNIIGAYNVLEYCRKTRVDRILYTQTVFDISLSVKDGEEIDPFTKRNFSYKGDHAMYVISKNTALELIEHYHQEYGLKKFIFRLPTIYNYTPYHYYFPNSIKTIRPLYYMIDKATNGEDIELWGDPKYSKDMVHVYDFSQMLCKAILANRNEGFYNVGTGKPVSLQEQIETIIEVFSPANKKSNIIFCPEKKAGGGFIMNIDNAKKELDYEPQFNCKKLFENFKEEMQLNKFLELRLKK